MDNRDGLGITGQLHCAGAAVGYQGACATSLSLGQAGFCYRLSEGGVELGDISTGPAAQRPLAFVFHQRVDHSQQATDRFPDPLGVTVRAGIVNGQASRARERDGLLPRHPFVDRSDPHLWQDGLQPVGVGGSVHQSRPA